MFRFMMSNAGILVCIMLGLAGISGVLLLDTFYWKKEILRETGPNLSLGHLVRSGLLFASALTGLLPFLLKGIFPGGPPLADCGSGVCGRTGMAVSAGLAFGFLLLFGFNMPFFCSLALEDSAVEWGSFVLWMAACAVLVAMLAGKWRKPHSPGCPRWLLLVAAQVFFVIGMEEVSWLQRVFAVETPEFFAGNSQGEMNFHNLGPASRGTDFVENAYYMAAFVFLVLLPFIRSVFPRFLEFAGLGFFAPREFLAVPGALACAYTYIMWNIAFIQIQFFASVIVLAAFAWRAVRPADRCLFGFALVLAIISQVVFLANGHRLLRNWDLTEYREFFIPLGFFLHVLDVRKRHMQARVGLQESAS